MEKSYLTLLQHILDKGHNKQDRTGIGTKSVFGYQLRHDLSEGFPLLTTKKVHWKSIVYELLWFLRGDTNIAFLKENKVSIWDEWADENGELGDVYGKQWRNWETKDGNFIDQITNVIKDIQNNPDSRRLIVSAWNVGELGKMKLPPCHLMFQFGVYEQKLSCHLLMRSVDCFLGLPFNIASYALLTQMVAQVCNLGLGELVISTVDTHIYNNHIEQVNLQLTREPYSLPKVKLNENITSIFDFKYEDIMLENYVTHEAIKAAVAV